jgi:hypothetical protein
MKPDVRDENGLLKVRIYFTALVLVAIWSLLGWSYYHGGVPSHHILADESLPSFSNWWGGLILPVLTWFLLYRLHKRIIRDNNSDNSTPVNYLKSILYGFAGALVFGILLSVFFTFAYTDLAGYLMMSVVPLALFLPIYRAECLLGFVMGMTFTFGGVLPTGIGSILLAISAVLYLLIRPGIHYVASSVARVASLNNNGH